MLRDSQSLRARMLACLNMSAMSSGGSSCQDAWRPRESSSSDAEAVRKGALGVHCVLEVASLCCLVSSRALSNRGLTLQCVTAIRRPSNLPAQHASSMSEPCPSRSVHATVVCVKAAQLLPRLLPESQLRRFTREHFPTFTTPQRRMHETKSRANMHSRQYVRSCSLENISGRSRAQWGSAPSNYQQGFRTSKSHLDGQDQVQEQLLILQLGVLRALEQALVGSSHS